MIPTPQQPKVIMVTPKKSIVEIEGLYPGYGITLGNAIRRILLSSLEGAAATSCRMIGVSHEFTTIKGVFEDVLEIALNLKKIRFRIFNDDIQTITLKAKGKGPVTAQAFEPNPQVEIINPETPVATLTEAKASLELELCVEKGIGYSLVENRRRKEKLPIGTIELDANFSPVVNVNFTVENMMVGERTDYNRLRLEIETDGTISATDAFNRGVDILIDQFQGIRTETSATSAEEPGVFTTLKESADIKAVPLTETGMSARVANVLARHRIKTVGDLGKNTRDKIRGLKGMGDKAFAEVEKVAKQYGLQMRA